jgi:hypothetical protein
MKIKEHGKHGDLENWSLEVTCAKDCRERGEGCGCGAVLEIGAADLCLMKWYGTHFAHYYAAVRCPECGSYLEVKDVPEPVWEVLLKDKSKAVFDGVDDRI